MAMSIDLPGVIEDFWIARQRAEYFPEAYRGRRILSP